MARTLDVYLHGDIVGHLIQDDDGQMFFDYAESWRENPAAMPLSHSLPLRKERFTRKECSGFFGDIASHVPTPQLAASVAGVIGGRTHMPNSRVDSKTAGPESATSACLCFSMSRIAGSHTGIRPGVPLGSSVWAGRPRQRGRCT